MTIATPISRDFRGPADLVLMGSMVSAAWAGPTRPLVPVTVGDLEWWVAGAGPGIDWSSRIRIWFLGDRPVAWGWLSPPASLDWFVVPGLAEATDRAVRLAVLDWLAGRARSTIASAPSVEPVLLETWAADDWFESSVLREAGWTPTETLLSQYVQSLDLPLDPPRVADGYELRSVVGPDEIPARVEAHRAAFAPSKMTVEKYEICVAQAHYAFDRDLVITAPNGEIAAFAMCWADPVGSVGEFEPVGVHPDHQRRGLGKAIMRAGLRRFRADGLRDALVFSLRSNAASEALYRASGFDCVAIHRQYTKPLET